MSLSFVQGIAVSALVAKPRTRGSGKRTPSEASKRVRSETRLPTQVRRIIASPRDAHMHASQGDSERKKGERASQPTDCMVDVPTRRYTSGGSGSDKLPLHLHKYVIIEFMEDADRRETSEATARVIMTRICRGGCPSTDRLFRVSLTLVRPFMRSKRMTLGPSDSKRPANKQYRRT
jgi:hypothetical protein